MLDYLAGLLQNRVLLAAVAGWTAAQVLKTILVLIILPRPVHWQRPVP